MTEDAPQTAEADPAATDGGAEALDHVEEKSPWSRRILDFLKSKPLRWSALGVGFVGVVSFFGNFATIVALFQPETASSVQVEALQSELAEQKQMIAQLLDQTAPADPLDASPIRDAERREAASRVAATDPAAARAIAEGDFRKGFRALEARAGELTAEAAVAWRDLGALAYDRDPAIALEAYRHAARIDPDHYETWMSLADLEFDQGGDVSAAKAAATAAIDAASGQRERLAALNALANLEYEDTEYQIAKHRFEQMVSVLRPLIAAEPDREAYLLILSDALDGLGNVHFMLGDSGAALVAQSEVLSIRRQLLAVSPGDPARSRDVSSALESIGELALDAGDLAGAEAAFAESLAIDRQLADDEPESLRARRNLAVSLEMYGDILMELNRPDEALAHYRESLQISRLQMASHPLNMTYREDVAFSLVQNGWAQLALGQDAAAAASFSEMVAIMRGVAAGQEDELRGQLYLTEALARAASATGNEAYAGEARNILAKLRSEGRLSPEIGGIIADIEGILPPSE